MGKLFNAGVVRSATGLPELYLHLIGEEPSLGHPRLGKLRLHWLPGGLRQLLSEFSPKKTLRLLS